MIISPRFYYNGGVARNAGGNMSQQRMSCLNDFVKFWLVKKSVVKW
ncbi:MAG: hypothetical protein PHU08_03840 [Dehalococcoidales bacterium]|nr:hypothetical protein [Dehalococcoidales bacterium]